VPILEHYFEPSSNSLEVTASKEKWRKSCLIDGGMAPQGQTTRKTWPHNLKSCPLNLRKPQYKKQHGLVSFINVTWNRLYYITFCIQVQGAWWTSEALEEAMEAIEQGTYLLRGPSWRFHIPLSSLSNHLNGHIRSRKMGPPKTRW